MEKPLWAWIFWGWVCDSAQKGHLSALGGMLLPGDSAELLPMQHQGKISESLKQEPSSYFEFLVHIEDLAHSHEYVTFVRESVQIECL